MMKSKYLAVALSAVALVACNNEDVLEVNQGRGISFQVATEASTRAQATTTSTIDNFKVWGFTDGKTLMNGLEVSKDGDDWTYDGTIFWPATDVDFYSVSPAENCGGTVSITKDAQKITGFTVNTDQSKQVDLLYAVNKGEKKADHAEGSKPVNINFRHALSQIVFKAKNTNENLKVIVKGVKIANIKKKGDFTYPTSATTDNVASESGSITWDTPTDATTFSAGMDANGVTLNGKVETAVDLTTTTGENANKTYTGALFMIPQALTPWNPETTGALSQTNTGVYFLLNCQILSGTDKNIQVWPSDADETFAEIAVPAETLTWEQGKKYVYTFIFGEGAGYEPGENPNPDPTLVGIDFDVTVDTFIAVTPDQDIDMGTGE